MLRYLCLLAMTGPLGAQDIPPYVPVNPALASRSALYAQPFVLPRDGWQPRLVIDYSNAVEAVAARDGRTYAFDAETMQVDLWLGRDMSRSVFAFGNVALRGGYDGFLDGFLNWYHDVIGLRVPARNRRTRNQFGWEFPLGGDSIVRERPGTFLGDLRLGGGARLSSRVQITATMTLPTATTRADGWARGTVGTALAVTARAAQTSRVSVDVGVSSGWTPTHGDLREFQRTVFVGALVAGRWRFAGRQAVFSTLWVQSPNWKDTGFRALDRAEVTLDLGGLFSVRQGWPEIQVGLTEDLLPSGPSVDAGFKLGIRW